MVDPNFEQKPGQQQSDPYGQPNPYGQQDNPYDSPQGVDPNAQQQFGPTTITDEEARQFGMIAHLLGLFTGFVGPLIIYLIKKDEHPFAKDQAAEALNFQITIIIASMVCGVLVCVYVGILLIPVLVILNIVFCIMAALAANDGKWYRYPINIRFVK